MWLLYWVKLKIEASISLQYKLRKLSEEHFSLNAVHSRELSSAQTLRGSQRLCPQGQQPDRVLKSWLGTWPGHYGDCSCCKFRYSRRNRKKSGVEEVGLAHNWFSLSSDIASFGQHNCYCEERLKLNKAICVNMPSHRDQTPLHKRGSCRNKMECFERKPADVKWRAEWDAPWQERVGLPHASFPWKLQAVWLTGQSAMHSQIFNPDITTLLSTK